jgi:hypothetical protein
MFAMKDMVVGFDVDLMSVGIVIYSCVLSTVTGKVILETA